MVHSDRFTPSYSDISSSRLDQHGVCAAPASRPFVLGFASGRSALTPAPHTRLAKTAGNAKKNGHNTTWEAT